MRLRACVPDMSECLGSLAGPDAAGIFFERDIADMKQAVFDLPMSPRQLQQGLGVHLSGGD